MAITHRAIILLTFPICCVSIALLATSLATNSWFQATATYKSKPGIDDINYGLFVGTHINRMKQTPILYTIYISCLSDEGICAWSCLNTEEERKDQVRELQQTGQYSQQCDLTNRAYHGTDRRRHRDTEIDDPNRYPEQRTFISMGLWATIIAFMAIAIVMAALGATFAVFNFAKNPVEPILGILGLFIWNVVAGAPARGLIQEYGTIFVTTALQRFLELCKNTCSSVIVLILWGVQFGITLTDNAVLPETISGETSSQGRAATGYSYWLVLVAALLHICCLGILTYRRHLLLKKPPTPTIRTDENSDGIIFLY